MWSKLKSVKEKLGIIGGILLMVFGVGIFGSVKFLVNYTITANQAITGYEIVVDRVDSLELRMKLIEVKLADYDIIKQNVIYLMQDNDILTGLLRSNMDKLDDKDYGTVLVLYDDVQGKLVRRLVEVKLRRAKGSKDLFVFAPWGKLLGIPITKKFAIKWNEDDEKYFFIDKDGDFHLIYEVDVKNTIYY